MHKVTGRVCLMQPPTCLMQPPAAERTMSIGPLGCSPILLFGDRFLISKELSSMAPRNDRLSVCSLVPVCFEIRVQFDSYISDLLLWRTNRLYLSMHEIMDTLWGARIQDLRHRLRNGDPVPSLQHDAYTRYCELQQSYLANELGIQDRVKDSGFVLDIAQLLRSNLTHQEVISGVGQRLNAGNIRVPVEYCEEITYFGARLLVMMNVGRFMSEAHLRRSIFWESSSLRQCLDNYFNEAPKMSCESVKLPKAFNAWSIDTVGGIKVRLTDNLADHLLLVEDDTTVLVFHHASFLEYQDTR